jgi:DNA-binding transcriptional MerR regulator
MSEFLLAEQLATKLDLMENELSQFESHGILKPVKKNGRTYYSSRDFYRLKGVLHFMRANGLSMEEAQDRVANWNWIPQAQSAGAGAH